MDASNKQEEYIASFVVIPICIAIVIIAIVVALAYIYLKNEERKAALLRVGLSQCASKAHPFSGSSTASTRCQSIVSEEGSLTLRYNDGSDRTRPLLARPPVPTVLWAQQQGPILEENEDFPSPYATLPFKFTTFNSPPKIKLPSPPPEARKCSMDNSHTPSSSVAVFCKADIHNHEFV